VANTPTVLTLAHPSGLPQFIVEIHYREPSYEARNGVRDAPFRFRYRIDASSADTAQKLALAELRRVTALSSVGWIRDVVDVSVIRVIGQVSIREVD
jgi:hypothetical protein